MVISHKFSLAKPEAHTPTLRLVTLDNFCANRHSPLAQSLFIKLAVIKADGYGPPDYPETMMPIEATDFVACHHIFCLDDGKTLEPIGGFKHITLERCDFYSLTPPYYSLAKGIEARPQVEALEQIFQDHRQTRKQLICSSGFTIDRNLRRADRSLSAQIKELVAALMYLDGTSLNATLIGGGVPRFKTELLWQKIGYRFIERGGKRLSPLTLPQAGDETIVLMKLDEPSAWARECFKKHQALIESRILIAAPSETKKAA